MSEGEDFTFMKSGFNNLVEKDETFENTDSFVFLKYVPQYLLKTRLRK